MKSFVAMLLIGAAAAPLAAQTTPDLPGRVGKLEKEMRAVQRKVFPGGAPLEPEIAPAPAPASPAGNPASNPVADLTARVDALEAQVRSITGQAEQAAFRLNQLEEQVKRLQADADARAAAATAAAAPPTVPASGSAEPTLAAGPAAGGAPASAVERPQTGDAAEDAYLYGYRLWQAKQYDAAAAELKGVAEKYPKHKRASYAQNLLGRTYLDQGKPALASVAFYDNYQKWPKGDRAPESLYWLGVSLTQLKKPAEACKVYAELNDVYGATLAAGLKAQVAEGKKKAKCA